MNKQSISARCVEAGGNPEHSIMQLNEAKVKLRSPSDSNREPLAPEANALPLSQETELLESNAGCLIYIPLKHCGIVPIGLSG